MRTIKTTSGTTIALDGDLLSVMEALYKEVTAKRELERSFEDMVKEIHHLIEQMDDSERRTYLAESLFLNTVKYEDEKLEAYMKKLTKKYLSLNFLATRFQCSWPWSTLVMLCDGRMVCGCADPYGKRVLGDARTSSIREVWTGSVVSSLRADLNSGGSKFCGDCPLK